MVRVELGGKLMLLGMKWLMAKNDVQGGKRVKGLNR